MHFLKAEVESVVTDVLRVFVKDNNQHDVMLTGPDQGSVYWF